MIDTFLILAGHSIPADSAYLTLNLTHYEQKWSMLFLITIKQK